VKELKSCSATKPNLIAPEMKRGSKVRHDMDGDDIVYDEVME
jgi:hypothetical protein